MKLYCIRDTEPYSYLTVWYDYQELAALRGYEFISFDSIHELLSLVHDESPCLFIAEAATLQRIHLRNIKKCLPNSYVVILGSDTIHHGLDPSINPEVPGALEHVNLWLDLVQAVVDSYRHYGMNAALWHWTTSEWYVQEFCSIAAGLPAKDKGTRSVDLIGLFRNNTDYRKKLWAGLEAEGLPCKKSGQGISYDPKELYDAYSSSLLTLGTTSPSWTNCRTIKGFRDWIGPLCGSMLIYDNHPQIRNEYEHLIPIFYDYDDPIGDIKFWVDSCRNVFDAVSCQTIIDIQADWVRQNTIVKQLHKLIPAQLL